MYKSSISHQKAEKLKYPSSKAYNLLSPPYNPKQRTKGYLNSNIPKYQPINLYSTCQSPFQTGKNLSVKNISSPDDKVSQNLMNKFSDHQKNVSSKLFGSPNTTNSDLLTTASLTSQQSNESINTSIYIPTSFQPVSYPMCDFQKGHRYNYSMINPQMTQMTMNNFYNMNNNMFINGNYPNVNMSCLKGNQVLANQNKNKMSQNSKKNVNKFSKFPGKNNNNINKNNINNGEKEKINVSNFDSNNSSKSKSSSNKTNSDSCKISSSNNSNSNNSNAQCSSQNLSMNSKKIFQ